MCGRSSLEACNLAGVGKVVSYRYYRVARTRLGTGWLSSAARCHDQQHTSVNISPAATLQLEDQSASQRWAGSLIWATVLSTKSRYLHADIAKKKKTTCEKHLDAKHSIKGFFSIRERKGESPYSKSRLSSAFNQYTILPLSLSRSCLRNSWSSLRSRFESTTS